MELSGDVGHVESHLFLFGDSITAVQERCTVCAKCTIYVEIILDAPDGTPKWWGSSESSVYLGIVFFLMQDKRTICVELTIASKIVWTHPMELLGDVGHVESRFFPFEEAISVGARQVHGLH
jgi:hypothetical protein